MLLVKYWDAAICEYPQKKDRSADSVIQEALSERELHKINNKLHIHIY